MSSAEDKDIERLGEWLERLERGESLPVEADENEVRQALEDVRQIGGLLEEHGPAAAPELPDAAAKAVATGLAQGLRELEERRDSQPKGPRPATIAATVVALAAAVLAFVSLWGNRGEERTPDDRSLGNSLDVRCVHPVGETLERYSPFRIEVPIDATWTWTLKIYDATAPSGTPALHVIEDLDRASWEWQGDENELPDAIRWEASVMGEDLRLIGTAKASASRR